MKSDMTEFERVDTRDPREVLKYRAKRLIRFLENPATPTMFIAEEVYLIFKAGMRCCESDLRIRIRKWLDSEPACRNCTSFKDDAHTGCLSCTKGDIPTD